jgi:hypothetical protein
VDEAIDYADQQIREIGQNIKSRIDRDSSFDDLYTDLQRYRLLRSSIDKVIGRLRETASLSLRSEVFEQNVQKLARTLRDLKT